MLHPLLNLNQNDKIQCRYQWIMQWCWKMDSTVFLLNTIYVSLILYCFPSSCNLNNTHLHTPGIGWKTAKIFICRSSPFFMTPGASQFIQKTKITSASEHAFTTQWAESGWVRVVFFFFPQTKSSIPVPLMMGKKNNNFSPLTQLQSAAKPQGRTWKESAWPSYQLLPKKIKWYFIQ